MGASNLRKNIAFQYGLQAAKYLFPLITLPYLTRVLGPDGYAVRAYVVAAMVFFQVFLDYGFLPYGTREIAICRKSSGSIGRQMSVISISKILLCGVAIPLLVGVVLLIPLLRENTLYVILAYLGICVKALLPDFVFQGIEEMGIITKRFVASQAIVVVCTFALIRSPNDLLWIPAIELIGSSIALCWSWTNIMFTRSIRLCGVRLTEVRTVFRRCTPYFLSNASTTAYTALLTVTIGLFISSDADISYWSLSMSVISMAQSLYSPLSNSIFPRVCVERSFGLVKKTLLAGVPLAFAATLAIALFSKTIMLILGGSEYLDGALVLTMVSPVLLLSFPAVFLGYPVLAAVGEGVKLAISSAVAAAFSVGGLVLLITTGGFTIYSICALRCGIELVLALSRAWFSVPYLRYGFEGGRSRLGKGAI